MGVKLVKGIAALIFLAGFSHAVSAATAGTGGVGTAFSKNSTNVGVVVGSGSAFTIALPAAEPDARQRPVDGALQTTHS